MDPVLSLLKLQNIGGVLETLSQGSLIRVAQTLNPDDHAHRELLHDLEAFIKARDALAITLKREAARTKTKVSFMGL